MMTEGYGNSSVSRRPYEPAMDLPDDVFHRTRIGIGFSLGTNGIIKNRSPTEQKFLPFLRVLRITTKKELKLKVMPPRSKGMTGH